jgi:hypothetical protein
MSARAFGAGAAASRFNPGIVNDPTGCLYDYNVFNVTLNSANAPRPTVTTPTMQTIAINPNNNPYSIGVAASSRP